MFPRLWIEQLRGHILSNFVWNAILLVGLLTLYLLLPQVVAIAHAHLRGSGFVPSEFEARVFADHWKIIALTALFTLVIGEVQGFVLRRNQAKPFVNPRFQAMIAELAQRAGLPYTPAIIFIAGHLGDASVADWFGRNRVAKVGTNCWQCPRQL